MDAIHWGLSSLLRFIAWLHPTDEIIITPLSNVELFIRPPENRVIIDPDDKFYQSGIFRK